MNLKNRHVTYSKKVQCLLLLLLCFSIFWLTKPINALAAYTTYHPSSYKVFHPGDTYGTATYNNFTYKLVLYETDINSPVNTSTVKTYFRTNTYSGDKNVEQWSGSKSDIYVTGGQSGNLEIVTKNTSSSHYSTIINTNNYYKDVMLNAKITIPAHYYYVSGGYKIDAPGAENRLGYTATHAASCPDTDLLSYSATQRTVDVRFRISLNNCGVLTVIPPPATTGPPYDRYCNCSYALYLKEGFYSVRYDTNGGYGSAPANQKAYYGTSFTAKSGNNLSKPGKVFAGWAVENPNATEADIPADALSTLNGTQLLTKAQAAGSSISGYNGNIKLYAVYKDGNTAWSYTFTDHPVGEKFKDIILEKVPHPPVELKHKIVKHLKVEDGADGTNIPLEGITFELYKKVDNPDDTVSYEPVLDSTKKPITGITDSNGEITFNIDYSPTTEPDFHYMVGWNEASEETRQKIIDEALEENPDLTEKKIAEKYYATLNDAETAYKANKFSKWDSYVNNDHAFKSEAEALQELEKYRTNPEHSDYSAKYYVKENLDEYEGPYNIIDPNASGDLPDEEIYKEVTFNNEATIPQTVIENDSTWEKDVYNADFNMTPLFVFRKVDSDNKPVPGGTFKVTSPIPLFTEEEYKERESMTPEQIAADPKNENKVRNYTTDENGLIVLYGDNQYYSIPNLEYGKAEKQDDGSYRYYNQNGGSYLEGRPNDPTSPLKDYFKWCDEKGYAYSVEDALAPYLSTDPANAEKHKLYKIINGFDDEGNKDDSARRAEITYTYKVKEISAPTGYKIPSTDEVTFTQDYYDASDLSDNVFEKENTMLLNNHITIDGTPYSPDGYLFYTDGTTPQNINLSITPNNTSIASVTWYKFDETKNMWVKISRGSATNYAFNHTVTEPTDESEMRFKAVATLANGKQEESQTFTIHINTAFDEPYTMFNVDEVEQNGNVAYIDYSADPEVPEETHLVEMGTLTAYPNKTIDTITWQKRTYPYGENPEAEEGWEILPDATDIAVSEKVIVSSANKSVVEYQQIITYDDGTTETYKYKILLNALRNGIYVDKVYQGKTDAYISYEENGNNHKQLSMGIGEASDYPDNLRRVVWIKQEAGASTWQTITNPSWLTPGIDATLDVGETDTGTVIYRANLIDQSNQLIEQRDYTIHLNTEPPEEPSGEQEESEEEELANAFSIGPDKEYRFLEPHTPEIHPVTENKNGKQKIEIKKTDGVNLLKEGVEFTAYFNKGRTLSTELLKKYFDALGGSAKINEIVFQNNMTAPAGTPVADVSVKQDGKVIAYWNNNKLYVGPPDANKIHAEEGFAAQFTPVTVTTGSVIADDSSVDEKTLMDTTSIMTQLTSDDIVLDEDKYHARIYVDDAFNSAETSYNEASASGVADVTGYVPNNPSHTGKYKVTLVWDYDYADENVASIRWLRQNPSTSEWQEIETGTNYMQLMDEDTETDESIQIKYRAEITLNNSQTRLCNFTINFNGNPPAGSLPAQIAQAHPGGGTKTGIYALSNSFTVNSTGMVFSYIVNKEKAREYGEEFMDPANWKPYEKHFESKAEAEAACNAYVNGLYNAYKQKYKIVETQHPQGNEVATVDDQILTGNETKGLDVEDPPIGPRSKAVTGSRNGNQGINITKTNPAGERLSEGVEFTVKYGNKYELDTDLLQKYIDKLGSSNVNRITFVTTPIIGHNNWADLSALQDGSVMAYWENNTIYIGTPDSNKVKTDKDIQALFGGSSFDPSSLVNEISIDGALKSGSTQLDGVTDAYLSYDANHTGPYNIDILCKSGVYSLNDVNVYKRVNGGAETLVGGAELVDINMNTPVHDTCTLTSDSTGTIEYIIRVEPEVDPPFEARYIIHLNETAPAGSIAAQIAEASGVTVDTTGLTVVSSFPNNKETTTMSSFNGNDLVNKLYVDNVLNSGSREVEDITKGYLSYNASHASTPYNIRLKSDIGLAIDSVNVQKSTNGGSTWTPVDNASVNVSGNTVQVDDTYTLANSNPAEMQYIITATDAEDHDIHTMTYHLYLNEEAPANSIASMAKGGVYQFSRNYSISNIGIRYLYLTNAGELSENQITNWLNGATAAEKRYRTKAQAEAALNAHLNEINALYETKYSIEETQHPDMYLPATINDITIQGTNTVNRDVVDPFAYGSIKVHKMNDKGTRNLEGVEFALYTTNPAYKQVGGQDNVSFEYDGDGDGTKEKYYLQTSQTTDRNGETTFENVISNFEYRYLMKETRTIDGYNLLKDVIYIGTMPLESTLAPANNYAGNYIQKDGKYYYFDLNYEVKNSASLTPPFTGGLASYWFCIGIIFVAFGLVAYFWKKKQPLPKA